MVSQKAIVTIVGINVDYSSQFEHLQNLLSGLLGVPTSVTVESVMTTSGSKLFGTQGNQRDDASFSPNSDYIMGTKLDILGPRYQPLQSGFQRHGKQSSLTPSPFLSGMRKLPSNLSTSSQISSRCSRSSHDMADPPRKLSEIAESPARDMSRSRQERRASSPLPYLQLTEENLRRNSYSNSSQRLRTSATKSHKRPRTSHTPSPSVAKARPPPVIIHAQKPRKSNLKKRRQSDTSMPRLSAEKSEVESHTTTEIIRELAETPPVVLNPFGEPLQDADIKYAFDQVDGNGDGRITLKEFSHTLAALQIEIDSTKLKKLFQDLDSDNNGCLDYNEFRDAISRVHPTNAEIWQKMLSASTLDLRPRASDLDLEQIRRILSDRGSEWTDRIDATHSFCKHAVQPMSRKKFDKIMRPIREHLLQQLSDRRSAVVREVCIVLAKIAMVRQDYLTRWAPRILERLFETVRINVEIMAVSAAQAIKSIIRCVPDSKRLEMLTTLINASRDNHVTARRNAYDSISFMLERTRDQKIGRSSKFWKLVIQTLNVGMKDSAHEVRESAYLGTANLYLLNPSRTGKNLLVDLKGARLNRFYKVLDEFTKQLDIHE